MFELMLLACLARDPVHCEQFWVATEAPLGMMECMVTGQQYLVRWTAEHPDWQVRIWRCALPRA
jgi:hypothetical protein